MKDGTNERLAQLRAERAGKKAALGMSLGGRFELQSVTQDPQTGHYFISGKLRCVVIGSPHRRDEDKVLTNIRVFPSAHGKPPEVWPGDWDKVGGRIWAAILEYTLRYADDPSEDGFITEALAKAKAGKTATEFSSPEALKEYLHDHPDADPKKHTVTKGEEGGGSKDDDEGDNKPVALSREGYKAVAQALDGFEEPGPWGHVVSYAISGKPMEPKHVKKVVDEIERDLKNWGAVSKANGWTAKDKKNLTQAKGILENSLKGGGKTATNIFGVPMKFANTADMRREAAATPGSLSGWAKANTPSGVQYTWSQGTQAFQLEPGMPEVPVQSIAGPRWKLR